MPKSEPSRPPEGAEPHASAPAPLLPGVRRVKIPWWGSVTFDDERRAQIDQFFQAPMIVVTILTFPVIAVDLFVLHGDWDRVWTPFWWVFFCATLTVWLAFVVEYVVKITAAEDRLEYARRHWLDLIIIAGPVLRLFRIAVVARSARVLTLRGVGTKLLHSVFMLVIGLEATERLLKRLGLDPTRKKGRLETRNMTRRELMLELERLRRRVDAWEEWSTAYKKHRQQHSAGPDKPFTRPTPAPEDDETQD